MKGRTAARSLAEQKLTLLAAGTAPRRRAGAADAAALAEQVEWDRLGTLLARRRLLPTLGPRIVELSEGRASDAFVDAVEQAVVACRRQASFLSLVGEHARERLAEKGVRSTPLKGPSLSAALYGDIGRRLSGDVDILVAAGDLPRAVEVVRGLGYGRPGDYVMDSGLPLLHFALEHERGELPTIEMHWRIHWYESRFAEDRLLAPSLAAQPLWRPKPADVLVSLLLFYARDGFIDLRLASDLAAWWDLEGSLLEPGALDEQRRRYPELARVIVAATTAAQRTVGLPADLVCGEQPALNARGRIAVRLANPNPRTSQSQLYADMGLIDGLLMPPGELRRFVRRQLLPPREVLQAQARHAAKQRARSAVGHGTGAIARYSLTLARLMRAPEAIR